MFCHHIIIVVLLLSGENATTLLSCKESVKTGITDNTVLIINFILLHAAKCLSFNQLRLLKNTSFVAQQAYSNWLAVNSAVRRHVQSVKVNIRIFN